MFVRDIFIDRRFNPPRVTVLALAPVKRQKIYCQLIDSNGAKSVVKESHHYFMDGVVPPFCHFKCFSIYFTLPKDTRLVFLLILIRHPVGTSNLNLDFFSKCFQLQLTFSEEIFVVNGISHYILPKSCYTLLLKLVKSLQVKCSDFDICRSELKIIPGKPHSINVLLILAFVVI